MVLSILASCRHDDERVDVIAEHLRREQMDDGGWNCRRFRGDTHSSMNTTISVLEGLRAYELFRRPRKKDIAAAQARGREFLLVHRLFRSHRTGTVMRPEFTRFVFPPRCPLCGDPVDRLFVAIALAGVALCDERRVSQLPLRMRRLMRVLAREIDADGLHRSRSAKVQLPLRTEHSSPPSTHRALRCPSCWRSTHR